MSKTSHDYKKELKDSLTDALYLTGGLYVYILGIIETRGLVNQHFLLQLKTSER